MQKSRVLIIAGSDPSGGAGIQADIKTVTALGCYAAAAITALTAQNTTGVFGVMEVPPAFVKQQVSLVLEDIGADCIKTGMLHNTKIIEALAELLSQYNDIPFILDPVMVATSGDLLIKGESPVNAMQTLLFPLATLVTANIPEAKILSGINITDTKTMIKAGEMILTHGAKNALVKGGHMDGDVVQDILVSSDGSFKIFEHNRINSRNTHGTGCTLASAIACGIAKGGSLKDSIIKARKYVYEAIRTAPGFGKGKGPLNHLVG